MAKRRSKFEIMAEILRIAKKGAIKTRIVYMVNLNFTVLHQYLRELERCGLIENDAENGGIIKTTERGMQYLKHYDRFKNFLNTVDPKPYEGCISLIHKK